jgi:hypothetical protein
MRRSLPFILATTMAAPASADVYRASNWLYVIPLSADSFEVIEETRTSPSDMYCAAADYTRRIGRDVPRQRLYVLEARGPSKTQAGRKSVVFTLAPTEEMKDTANSFSVTVKQVGASISVGQSLSFCRSPIEEIF